MSDALSEVLRAVRLKGAVFFDVEGRDPWVAEAPSGAEIGPYIMPGVEHVIEYHVVTEGACYATLLGHPAILMRAGDVVVFPQGDPHVMSSAPGMRGEPQLSVLQSLRPHAPPMIIQKGDGATTKVRLVCGFLGCDVRPFNPLVSYLPRVLHVRAEDLRDSVAPRFVEIALGEAGALTAGSQSVLARLSELLFIDVVRRYLNTLPSEAKGFLAGLRDPYVGRALEKLHAAPARPWTLEELAREVGTSRSILAERFADFVGIPPIQYLSQWRIHLAASALANGVQSLAEIAAQVGYGSETSLSRAFKREVGVAPAMWRRGQRPLAGVSLAD